MLHEKDLCTYCYILKPFGYNELCDAFERGHFDTVDYCLRLRETIDTSEHVFDPLKVCVKAISREKLYIVKLMIERYPSVKRQLYNRNWKEGFDGCRRDLNMARRMRVLLGTKEVTRD